MKIKNEYIMRNIAGDDVLVPIGKTVTDFNGLIILNEMAKFIWEKMIEVESEDELLNCILDEYEVEKDVAKADLDEFLNILKENNII